ncbi:MAG: hypothetical protein M4579_005963 [Chaenotheca gracillima]|nr:MAG: hypothetical protein M4579_005963 [Chaenotheca gracillima]
MSNQSIIRITRELGEIQRSSDLSLAVACRDVDVRSVRAIIIGPPETPYEFGFFEVRRLPRSLRPMRTDSRLQFALKFGKGADPIVDVDAGTLLITSTFAEYPGKAPSVSALTTNGGRCRFNPNIYSNGKVCLSILGTWRGERGEEWSSAQGLESILISIQSLMSSNPYENEPGFEDAKADHDKKNIDNYVAKIRHETLRISIIQRMEDFLGINPDGTLQPRSQRDEFKEPEKDDSIDDSLPSFEPFKDLCKRRFLWYYDSYLLSIEGAKDKVKDDQAFAKMPFECSGNGMEGKFRFSELERRIKFIREMLDKETEDWAAEGLLAKKKEAGIAANLQRQFEQSVEAYKRDDNVTLDIELVDKNPFVWQITYFGRPMTNLDGGLFRVRVNFSPRFPDEQPRVQFETPMFHHRISKDGVVCYFPRREEDVKSHIEAIVEALEEESPPYDPRTMVNPEAAKLYWGSADDKKNYNRRLRQAVQRSME